MKEQVTETTTVSKDTFDAAVKNWTNVVGTTGTTFLQNVAMARQYSIPMADMQAMVNEHARNGAVSVTSYVGAVKYGTNAKGETEYEQHLYFVGIDAKGSPIWSVDGQSAIYDLVLPCPPTC